MTDNPPIRIQRLVRSRRKSIALIVELDGGLTVRVPLRLSHDVIEAFVQEHASWILQKQQEAWQQRAMSGMKLYAPGELFWYLGEQYPLEIVPAVTPLLVLDGTFKMASQALPRAEQVFILWYREQARQVIGERVKLHARRLGLACEKLRITGARTRWGSCSSKKTLSFTWRLVLAPLPAVDYVVVHELCHLVEPNHSKAFWSSVAAALPDYKPRRAWLRKNGPGLDLKPVQDPSQATQTGRRSAPSTSQKRKP
ncbi:MAG TPA: SprT family zinc-dependent metalloprotease [Anaerolineales bacterium]|nr:SprT family zinc-dependent metalloprotease [Anaerolineales bacterium]